MPDWLKALLRASTKKQLEELSDWIDDNSGIKIKDTLIEEIQEALDDAEDIEDTNVDDNIGNV